MAASVFDADDPRRADENTSSHYKAENPGAEAELLASVSDWGVDRSPDIINMTKWNVI